MAGAEFKKGYNKGFEDGANSVEEGLPGWFGTFADMMTLLFAFFVLLAAISTMDPVKLQEMSNSEGKSLGSKIKSSGKAEEEGEFEPIKNLAAMKKEMEETIEEMKKENPKGDPPIDIQTSSKGLIVNIKGDYAFPIGKASMKEELKGLLDEEIIPKIQASPFQVEVAGHSDSDRMPKKWRKNFATNWELSAARGASVVRYMIDKGIPAPRLLAAGYGPWAPHGLDSVKKQNPMWNPLTLTWKDPVLTKDGKEMPTVLGLNNNERMKSKNRRIQITFLNPPHHGKGRSATSYED
jgi:chemotaxis protein MotB|tara:strand:+ start:745 stop:1626 length:882 start_codon:yes stop_codon:yes gene_type:complete